jgi:hypothetical protein
MTSTYKVVAFCRDAASSNWGTVIEFVSHGCEWQVAVSWAALHGALGRVARDLARLGLHVGRDKAARETFARILMNGSNPEGRVTLSEPFGQHGIMTLAFGPAQRRRPAVD